MSTTRVTPARRLGQVVTGLGALIVLLILLAGAPVALLAFAGNPLPDEVPSAAAVGAALTSRDDGQLFLRALAVVGWLGWATFLVSVLVEVPARLLRRPAPRLPGLNRQQRVAAALIGSISLILVASPAAAVAAPGAVEATTVVAVSTGFGAAPTDAAPTAAQATDAQAAADRATPHQLATAGQAGPLVSPAALHALATAPASTPERPGTDADAADPVYRVAKGDYLGHIADRYLGEFGDYRQLAALNEIDDPDRIRAGQLLRLPADATDTGVRPHANGTVLTPTPTPESPAPPAAEQPAPQPPAAQQPPAGQPTTPPPAVDVPSDAGTAPTQRPAWQIGDDGAAGNLGGGVSAGSSGPQQNLNRPLAVAAVITAASIVGAQIGTVLGLKRRTAGAPTDSGRHRRYRD